MINNNNNNNNNKLHVIILANENGARFLIANAMSADRNVITKEAEKIVKFKDLARAVERM
jgi:hypothetical protein